MEVVAGIVKISDVAVERDGRREKWCTCPQPKLEA